MMNVSLNSLNQKTLEAWDANAQGWDEHMGDEGNSFHQVLVRPAIERLLQLKPGQKILDIGCGNGLTTRRLSSLGAKILGIDFSPEMIKYARKRTTENQKLIEYKVLDATDEQALLSLGEKSFDAAVSAMTLMDMAELDPLFLALTKLLHPDGCFIFAIAHPCFNNPHVNTMSELVENEDGVSVKYSVKVKEYLQPTHVKGFALAKQSQQKQHIYFHRPLHILLGKAFAAGFILDGLEEPAFSSSADSPTIPLIWGANFSHIPPVIVVRLKIN
ncbi:MAG: class I SAM-dependent methyltransferase [Cyanobacteria bacterium P01_A01_bin.84]